MATKIEIAQTLRNMAEHHLFGGAGWPIDDKETNEAIRRQFMEWGLLAGDDQYGFSSTTLGGELDLDLMSAFMGHFEPFDIPCILERCGLITQEEEEIILDRWEAGGEELDDILLPILRRLYLARFKQ
jgi:hypothetical protein